MFATLIVCLPSRHEGGMRVVSHQQREMTFDLRNARVSHLSYAALYADCTHEILPITEGYRIALVYNLVRAGGPLLAPDHRAPIANVSALLGSWAGSEEMPNKMLCALEHHYTPAGLSFAGLKGADAAAAHVLVSAAREAGCCHT